MRQTVRLMPIVCYMCPPPSSTDLPLAQPAAGMFSSPPYLQTCVQALFSATLHSKLGSLATLSLRDPVAVGFRYTTCCDKSCDERCNAPLAGE